MTKILFALIILCFSCAIWACPGCHDSVKGSNSQYTFIILGVFIALIYVPFFFLFRAAHTYDPKRLDEHN